MKRAILNIIQKFLIKSFNSRIVKNPPKGVSIDCYTTIQNLLKFYSPKNVCDVGAHDGVWSATLTEYCKTIDSIAFIEPQQKYIDILSALKFPNVKTTILKNGVSDKSDVMEIKGGNACASFLEFDHTFDTVFTGKLDETSEHVQVETLDTIYQKNNLIQPDLVKIDVQGLELEVINGGQNIINNAKVLIVELSTLPFYSGQKSLSSIFNKLEEMNFTLIEIGYVWREDYDQSKKILQFDGIFMKNL